jgi:hypothetical protein
MECHGAECYPPCLFEEEKRRQDIGGLQAVVFLPNWGNAHESALLCSLITSVCEGLYEAPRDTGMLSVFRRKALDMNLPEERVSLYPPFCYNTSRQKTGAGSSNGQSIRLRI